MASPNATLARIPCLAWVCGLQGGPGPLLRCIPCRVFATCVAFSALFLSEISLIEIGFTPHVSGFIFALGPFGSKAVLESLRAPRAWASFFVRPLCLLCALGVKRRWRHFEVHG